MYTFADYLRAAEVVPPIEAFLIPMPHEPFPHQIPALKKMLEYDRVGLFDDAGTGKTLPLQAYAALFALLGNKVIVCMPPALLGQFAETYAEFFAGIDAYLHIATFRGTVKQRDKMTEEWNRCNTWPDVLLMTYQMFSSFHHLKTKKDKTVRRKNMPSYIKKGVTRDAKHRLLDKGYNVLVLDESQAVKTISSAITKKVNRYINHDDCNLVLSTGSPLGNTPEDCYAPIKMLTPWIYATKAAFERKHIIRNIHSPFKEIEEFINLDVLHINMFKQARRVTKEEVTKDLPEKLVSAIPVELSAAHKKLYRSLLTARILEFDGQVLDATNASKLRMTALQLISNPLNYMDAGSTIDNNLFEACDQLIDSIDPKQHKIIIFSNFKATVAALKERYSEYNPATINSDTKDPNAERIRFTSDDSCRIIILNYIAGGVGLNLQIASYIIMFEPTGVPSQWHQAVARAHRAGQLADYVNVYLLDALHTYASRIIKNLIEKDEVANEVIRDPNKLLRELLYDD